MPPMSAHGSEEWPYSSDSYEDDPHERSNNEEDEEDKFIPHWSDTDPYDKGPYDGDEDSASEIDDDSEYDGITGHEDELTHYEPQDTENGNE